jgi:hypothetical protein
VHDVRFLSSGPSKFMTAGKEGFIQRSRKIDAVAFFRTL